MVFNCLYRTKTIMASKYKYTIRTVRAVLVMAVFIKMAASYDEECYTRPDVLYPHVECFKYYQCYLLVKVPVDCPMGQNFNRVRGHCDYSDPSCYYQTRHPNQWTYSLPTTPAIEPAQAPIKTYSSTTSATEMTTRATETTTRAAEMTTRAIQIAIKQMTISEECRSFIKDIDSWQSREVVVINCDKFIKCARNGPIVKGCPKGMTIGPTSMCELPHHVQCENIKGSTSYEENNRRQMEKALRILPKDLIEMILHHSDQAINVNGNISRLEESKSNGIVQSKMILHSSHPGIRENINSWEAEQFKSDGTDVKVILNPSDRAVSLSANGNSLDTEESKSDGTQLKVGLNPPDQTLSGNGNILDAEKSKSDGTQLNIIPNPSDQTLSGNGNRLDAAKSTSDTTDHLNVILNPSDQALSENGNSLDAVKSKSDGTDQLNVILSHSDIGNGNRLDLENPNSDGTRQVNVILNHSDQATSENSNSWEAGQFKSDGTKLNVSLSAPEQAVNINGNSLNAEKSKSDDTDMLNVILNPSDQAISENGNGLVYRKSTSNDTEQLNGSLNPFDQAISENSSWKARQFKSNGPEQLNVSLNAPDQALSGNGNRLETGKSKLDGTDKLKIILYPSDRAISGNGDRSETVASKNDTNKDNIRTSRDVNNKCPIGSNATFSHPTICEHYVICKNGIAIEMECSKGEKFNHKSMKCEQYSGGGCPGVFHKNVSSKGTSKRNVKLVQRRNQPTKMKNSFKSKSTRH